jgi:Arabinose efflux permease
MATMEAGLTRDQQALQDPGKFRVHVLIGAFLSWMFDAQDMCILGLAIPLVIKDFNLSLTGAGGLASAGLVGTALGALFWGSISDKIGRKKALIWCLVVFGVFTVLGGWANSITHLAILRFIAGLGLGGETVLGGTLITEFFDPERRALANGTVQSAFAVGYLLALLVNLYFVATYGWRALFWSAGLVIIAILYLWLLVPESPAWQRAQENRRLGIESTTHVTVKGVNWTDLFKGDNLKATILTAILAISTLVSYWGIGTWLPAYLGQKGINVKTLTGYLLAINMSAFFGYYFFGWVADKFGRRWSLFGGSVASAIIVFIYMQLATPGTMILLGIFFGFITYGYWGALATFIGEQFPTVLRGTGSSIAFGAGRIGSAVAPTLLGSLAATTGLQFALTLMVAVYLMGALASWFMRETKGEIIVD